MKIDVHLKLSGATLSLPPELRAQSRDIAKFCNEKRGGFIHIVIEPPRKLRSTGEKSANHHLNGHCVQIANHTGHEFSEIKTAVKNMAIKRGYPVQTVGRIAVAQSESVASVEECAMLIESAHELADFLSVILKEE